MPFVEDPSHLSKTRPRPGLFAHGLELPPAVSGKTRVERHLRDSDHRAAAEFSRDDDDHLILDVVDDEDLAGTKMSDLSDLTDDALKAMLLKYGVKPGPIVASTRALYERKLRKLLHSNGHSGAEDGVCYSDSEEERERHKDKESEPDHQEMIVASESQQGSRERPCSPRNKEPRSKGNSRNAIKSSGQTVPHRSQIPAGFSKTSSGLRSGVASGVQSVGCSSFETFSITQMVEEQMESRRFSASSDNEMTGSNVLEQRSQSNWLDLQCKDKRLEDQSAYHAPKDSCREQEMKVHWEPVADILKDIFPNTKASPTGIYATPRRPIKGAAQRPIQFSYPDTPVSPVTVQERRDVQRHLVPYWIQILVFFIVMGILYLIYINVEPSSPVLAMLESLNQWSNG